MTEADSRLHFLTIREASELLRTGELSPLELVRASLDRIEATEDRLHSFITILNPHFPYG